MDKNDKKEGLDFSNNDPAAALTEYQFIHFEEGMKPKNISDHSNDIDLGEAVQSTVKEMAALLA